MDVIVLTEAVSGEKISIRRSEFRNAEGTGDNQQTTFVQLSGPRRRVTVLESEFQVKRLLGMV